MKQSTQPVPAPRRPRSVKRTILLVLLVLLLVAVALLALRIYRTVTDPPIILVERQPSRSAAVATNPGPFSIPPNRAAVASIPSYLRFASTLRPEEARGRDLLS